MRLALALTAALGLAGLSLTALPAPEVHAQDTAAFKDKFAVTVARADGKLVVTVESKTVNGEQWYVNKDYPIRLKVAGAPVAKAELVKEDATFEGEDKAKPGKAKKAKFSTAVTGPAKASIEYKLVVCSDKSCSPPILGTFKEP
jgi:hypothetical protein